MPAIKQKSGLAAKLGQKLAQSVAAHKNEEVKINAGGDLPEIDFGIAKLVDCKFGIFKEGENKGQYYYMAMGTVVEPEEVIVNGLKIKVRGEFTKIGPEPICDTPKSSGKKKTMDDHLAYVLNELKKFLPKEEHANLSEDNLEDTAAALKEAAPYFKFRTWKGKKQEVTQAGGKWVFNGKTYPTEAALKAANPYAGQEPRCNHDWKGITDYTEANGQAESAVQDNTATAETQTEESGDDQGNEPPTDTTTTNDDVPFGDNLDMMADAAIGGDNAAELAILAKAEEAGCLEEAQNAADWNAAVAVIRAATGGDTDEALDYDALGTAGDEGDADAINTLTEKAKEAGVSDEEFAQMSWTELATHLAGLATPDADEPPAEFLPEVGQMFGFKPVDHKTKKKAAKFVEHEVMTVNPAKKTVTLKSADTGKLYLGADKKTANVSWDDLDQS